MMGETSLSVGLPKAPTGIDGFRRHHSRRPAGRAADIGVRCGGLRQDAVRRDFSGQRRGRVRRARRVHELRGTGRGPRGELRLARLRHRRAGRCRKARGRSRPESSKSEIEEAGDYDLEGLFVRLGFAVDQVGAKRIVLDTIEALFSGFSDTAILRAELRRLFGWIKDRGLTAIITGERGDGAAHPPRARGIRFGLRDPARQPRGGSDRDAAAAGREVPRLRARHQRISVPDRRRRNQRSAGHVGAAINRRCRARSSRAGIPGLDAMFRNGGFFRGSSILLSGVSGTGKTTIARISSMRPAAAASAACSSPSRRGREEICRNARSVGLDLQQSMDAGLLRFEAARPKPLRPGDASRANASRPRDDSSRRSW